jgi:hypothetical protein
VTREEGYEPTLTSADDLAMQEILIDKNSSTRICQGEMFRIGSVDLTNPAAHLG